MHSLAVLPFKSLSNDPAQDYLSEGITEALVTSLARIGTLRVISLASVTASPGDRKSPVEVAREWNAGAVLRGTVQRATNRVHIHAELVDAKTGTVYWSDNYERDTGDALVLQSEVAGAIAREIRVKLTPQEAQFLARTRKVDPEALNAYLKGRYSWNRRTEEKLQSAVRSFQQAIDIEPAYALAYAGLADSYALLGSTGSDGITGAKALPLAKAAATAHHWYAHYFLAAGHPDRALAEMKRAHDLEPLSAVINVGIGWCLYYSRQYAQAIAQYKSALELDPYFPLGHQMLGMAYQQNKMHKQAVDEFQKAVDYSGHSAEPFPPWPAPMRTRGGNRTLNASWRASPRWRAASMCPRSFSRTRIARSATSAKRSSRFLRRSTTVPTIWSTSARIRLWRASPRTRISSSSCRGSSRSVRGTNGISTRDFCRNFVRTSAGLSWFPPGIVQQVGDANESQPAGENYRNDHHASFEVFDQSCRSRRLSGCVFGPSCTSGELPP